jgi:serine phosphatase RsbU (regulator of sigma subunit)
MCMMDPAGSPEAPVLVEPPSPASTGWSLYGVQLSARIMTADGALTGGDWCESFAVAAGVIALSIGDVCGHGDAKFAVRVAIRESIRDAAHRGLDPAQTLIAAHYFLRNYDPAEYATAVFGLLNVEKRTFVFANAGHPGPLLCGAASATFLEYSDTYLPLGIEQMTMPGLHTVEIPDASLLVLYTDGVSERQRKPLQGALELRDAALFAYNFPSLPTAALIEKQMHMLSGNADDAALLTAWMPRRFQRSPARRL